MQVKEFVSNVGTTFLVCFLCLHSIPNPVQQKTVDVQVFAVDGDSLYSGTRQEVRETKIFDFEQSK
jgi:hypothetical protein